MPHTSDAPHMTDEDRRFVYQALRKKFNFDEEYSLASLGWCFVREGINREDYGFLKLKPMLEEMSDFVSLSTKVVGGSSQSMFTLHEMEAYENDGAIEADDLADAEDAVDEAADQHDSSQDEEDTEENVEEEKESTAENNAENQKVSTSDKKEDDSEEPSTKQELEEDKKASSEKKPNNKNKRNNKKEDKGEKDTTDDEQGVSEPEGAADSAEIAQDETVEVNAADATDGADAGDIATEGAAGAETPDAQAEKPARKSGSRRRKNVAHASSDAADEAQDAVAQSDAASESNETNAADNSVADASIEAPDADKKPAKTSVKRPPRGRGGAASGKETAAKLAEGKGENGANAQAAKADVRAEAQANKEANDASGEASKTDADAQDAKPADSKDAKPGKSKGAKAEADQSAKAKAAESKKAKGAGSAPSSEVEKASAASNASKQGKPAADQDKQGKSAGEFDKQSKPAREGDAQSKPTAEADKQQKQASDQDKKSKQTSRRSSKQSQDAASQQARAASSQPARNAGPGRRQARRVIPGKALERFGYLGTWQEFLRTLADLALDEPWDFCDTGLETRPKHFDILHNYIRYTFYRLTLEDKVGFSSDETFAVFNTGLVDRHYEDIYACFEPSDPDKPEEARYPWTFAGFCTAGTGRLGKRLVRELSPLPQTASYLERKEDLLFDLDRELVCDIHHIVVDNVHRLPLSFLRDELASSPECLGILAGIEELSDGARDERYARLREVIEGSTRLFNRLSTSINAAIDVAKRQVRWNYKTAVPAYYPRTNSMNLLLPLILTDSPTPDLALVVELQKSGNYQGQTIVTMAQAYRDARLLCRPYIDWLSPASIIDAADEEDEEE